jgi:hypothetical protein
LLSFLVPDVKMDEGGAGASALDRFPRDIGGADRIDYPGRYRLFHMRDWRHGEYDFAFGTHEDSLSRIISLD